MQTTLYLIRHGQTKWNQEQRMQGWQNSDLTDVGKNQAILLGEKLEKEAIVFDAFYSSPSERALETRGLINQSLRFPEYEASGLQEINMGNWEGKTYDEKGTCPVCKMELIEAKAENHEGHDHETENHEGHDHSEENHDGHNH